MKVSKLMEILKQCNPDDRVIIDTGELEANINNEVIFAEKILHVEKDGTRKILVLLECR